MVSSIHVYPEKENRRLREAKCLTQSHSAHKWCLCEVCLTLSLALFSMPRAPSRKSGEHMKALDNCMRHPASVSSCIIAFLRLQCYPTHAEVLPMNMLGVEYKRLYSGKGTHRSWGTGLAYYSGKRGLSMWGELCWCWEAGASSEILNTLLSVSLS